MAKTMPLSGGLQHYSQGHLALLPSAGVGHLTPFLRLAVRLLRHRCQVTLITAHPLVSLAETHLLSRFLSAFPQVSHKQFDVLPTNPSPSASSSDPFFSHVDATCRSVNLIQSLLSSVSSPPLSALITDVFLVNPLTSLSANLGLKCHVLFTSSARMVSFLAHFSVMPRSTDLNFVDRIEIPGILPIPKSSFPPLLLDPSSLFATLFSQDSKNLRKANGVLINTFEGLEGDSLTAFNRNRGRFVVDRLPLPPLLPMGPLMPCEFEKPKSESKLPLTEWLDKQTNTSVVYVSFGSRTATSKEQIKEIARGLVRSGFPFLWVVKEKMVDREEKRSLETLLGHQLMQRITKEEKGLVVKDWVNQVEILSHQAIGGFLSHCGWNSVVEAAWFGVPVLAWPQAGDQKINAEVVERSGLGMWVESWGWGGEVVVKGEEIGDRVKELMNREILRAEAAKIREEARIAVQDGGPREVTLKALAEEWVGSSS